MPARSVNNLIASLSQQLAFALEQCDALADELKAVRAQLAEATKPPPPAPLKVD